MNSINIKIGKEEFVVKQNFRALMIFENMTGVNAFNADNSVNHLLKLFYSILKGGNKNFNYEFEDFLDLIDDNPESVEVFSNYIQKLAKENTNSSTKPSTKKK